MIFRTSFAFESTLLAGDRGISAYPWVTGGVFAIYGPYFAF